MMIYLSVPLTPELDSDINQKEYESIRVLLTKHGYSIAYFGKENIKFYKYASVKYDIKNADGEKTSGIPITSYYNFSKKEFVIFLDVIQQLDDVEIKLNRCLRFMHSY
jgi:hypothetical protein